MNPLLLLLGLGLVVAVSSSKKSTSTPTPGPNPKGLPTPNQGLPTATNCRDALARLPPALQQQVVAAAQSGSTLVVGQAADAIEKAGFHDAADCLRQMAQQASGPPSAASCDAYLNDVPDAPYSAGLPGLRTQARDAIAKGDPATVRMIAYSLRTLGLLDAATCLDEVASTMAQKPAGGGQPLESSTATAVPPGGVYRVAVPSP